MKSCGAHIKGLRTRCRERFKSSLVRNPKTASWLLRKVKRSEVQRIKRDRNAWLKSICEWIPRLLNLFNAMAELIAKLREFFLSCKEPSRQIDVIY
jgi:hypothetical protein